MEHMHSRCITLNLHLPWQGSTSGSLGRKKHVKLFCDISMHVFQEALNPSRKRTCSEAVTLSISVLDTMNGENTRVCSAQ
jgi:hypothetical protein